MRIAVSGSHSTGKSTLIAAFLERCPQYVHEPEAYEVLADEIALNSSEGPDSEGLAALLEYTIAALANHRPGASVIFERSPVDYLAYAAASRSISPSERADFLREQAPAVRAAVRDLDLIALLPVCDDHVPARPGEDEHFRARVDDELRRALIDDDYDLFEGAHAPLVVELSPSPDRQLTELVQRAEAAHSNRVLRP